MYSIIGTTKDNPRMFMIHDRVGNCFQMSLGHLRTQYVVYGASRNLVVQVLSRSRSLRWNLSNFDMADERTSRQQRLVTLTVDRNGRVREDDVNGKRTWTRVRIDLRGSQLSS